MHVGQREAAARQCVPLSESLVRRHAKLHTLFVTFTNAAASIFAANWAKQLAAIGLSGIVGVVDRLPLVHLEAISSAGSGLFCGSGQYMRRNGQAGRWAEVAPLLRFGVHVLISDADIVWFRDPRPYFRDVRRVHPHVDFLLCTDRAFNGYHTAPLHRSRGAGAAREAVLATDLDLEDGVGSAIPSYNIGILMLYAHAASNLSAMIDVLWVRAVQTVEYDRRTGKKQPMNNGLARWDQGPINSFVLRGARHPHDHALVLLDKALPRADDVYAALDRQGSGPRVRLGMGVLPMLQFTTAFTYFIQAALREHAGARPFSLHAIYSHGGGTERKIALLREAHGWHDPPSYYADDQRGYLTYNASLPERALRHGGFEMIMAQLRRLELALRIAHLANRTLVMPPMRCGNLPMAYPCFAWYHRATTSGGFRHDRVPMPELCPSYYCAHALAAISRSPCEQRQSARHPGARPLAMHACACCRVRREAGGGPQAQVSRALVPHKPAHPESTLTQHRNPPHSLHARRARGRARKWSERAGARGRVSAHARAPLAWARSCGTRS